MQVPPNIFKTKQTITLSHTPLIDYETKHHWHGRQSLMHSPKSICLCPFFQPMNYESKLLNVNMISPNLKVQFSSVPSDSPCLASWHSTFLTSSKGPDDSDPHQSTLHSNPEQHNRLTEARGSHSHEELNVRKHSGLQTSLNANSNVSRALNLTCKIVIC